MSVPAAFLGVIAIWSTTPLAIKWSSEGPGFLFGVTARMALGTLLCLALIKLGRTPFPFDAAARRTYVAAGLGIFMSMLSTYWASQFIPSGLISVLFGLTPIATGLMASFWLAERSFTLPKLAGMVLGIVGLAVIFRSNLQFGAASTLGIAALVLAVLTHSASAVWIKRIGAATPALATTGGGLVIATALYLLVWLVSGASWPQALPPKAISSIVYLAVFGSVLGFVLYYYALKHLAAGQIALITLVTPVAALLIGVWFNGERVGLRIVIGAVLVLLGVVLHQAPAMRAKRRGRRNAENATEPPPAP